MVANSNLENGKKFCDGDRGFENFAIASSANSRQNENKPPTATTEPTRLIQLRKSDGRCGVLSLFSGFMLDMAMALASIDAGSFAWSVADQVSSSGCEHKRPEP